MADSASPTNNRNSAVRQAAPWLLLAALLTVSLPIVLATPLTSDTVLYDLQAKTVLNGGVLYRDILEPNLPGIVWLHLLIRTVVGWSSEAIRAVDLLIAAVSFWLLTGLATDPRIVNGPDHPWSRVTVRGWLVLMMAVFYLSRNEWCHCQRDSWMLLPSVMAVRLRLNRVNSDASKHHERLSFLLEGVLWGTAFWIKPHVAIPAIAVAVVDLWLSHERWREFRGILLTIVGGLLVAIPGLAWLVNTDAWRFFLDMQLNWNPEYLTAGSDRRSWTRVWLMIQRFHPWWLVHLAGLILTIKIFRRLRSERRNVNRILVADQIAICLATLAVTWFLQASLLQHAMDYIQVPAIILMLGFLGTICVRQATVHVPWAVATLLALGLMASPQFSRPRLELWPALITGQYHWKERNILANGRFPNWTDTGIVVDYLKDRQVQPGDVTCFNVHSIHMYQALEILPSTRYVGASVLPALFPSHRVQIESAVAKTGHRYVITDDDEVKPCPDQFPWNLPVVFRSGSIAVHAVGQNAAVSNRMISATQ